MNDSYIIEVKNLKKTYAGKKYFEDINAVNDISFDVKKGELFGLLGPNGAGKTTTIGMLCGLIIPTSGVAKVGGLNVQEKSYDIKKFIGVCPQEVSVYKFLNARENIELFGSTYLMEKKELTNRTNKFLELFGLLRASGRKVKEFSGGMLRQLNLILAIIHDPDILFLDEPTVGMDPRVRRSTWDVIISLKEQGKTIVLTTHYMEEAESLCDRVAIVDYGELIDLGTPRELIGKHDSKNLEEVFMKITGRRIVEGM
ncbi:MAG: ABC transporter ATP-binding protein [Candidatus Lokiarchaeota archaeon]|nr:ABC transporter ATP-binding protein [Candidatus Lokiarchaeota archaeon]